MARFYVRYVKLPQDSKRVLSGHMWKSHRVKQLARLFAFDKHCPICPKLYPARPNLITHIARYAHDNNCLKILQDNFQPLSREDVDALDAKDLILIEHLKSQGLHKPHSCAPVLRIFGPFPSCCNV